MIIFFGLMRNDRSIAVSQKYVFRFVLDGVNFNRKSNFELQNIIKNTQMVSNNRENV